MTFLSHVPHGSYIIDGYGVVHIKMPDRQWLVLCHGAFASSQMQQSTGEETPSCLWCINNSVSDLDWSWYGNQTRDT